MIRTTIRVILTTASLLSGGSDSSIAIWDLDQNDVDRETQHNIYKPLSYLSKYYQDKIGTA